MPEHSFKARKAFEAKILEEAPRMTREDSFRFACHPGVPCFGECCGDVNIVLTPYDVLRLKKRLGLTSKEFLDRHTLLPFSKEQRIPAPFLKMGEEGKKSCPFVLDGACTVYEDRPWACRMFPLGYASPGKGNQEQKEFWFQIEESFCRGYEEEQVQTVDEWLTDQRIEEYDIWGERYKELAVDRYLATDRELDPRKMQMFFLATYDLDTFRRFVFDSSFLDRFEVSEDEVERLKVDDEELLRFGFKWLKFSLFEEPTMKIKP